MHCGGSLCVCAQRYEVFSCVTKGAVLVNPSIETKVAPGDSLYILASAVGA